MALGLQIYAKICMMNFNFCPIISSPRRHSMERISLLLHLFTVTSNVHVLVGLSFVDTFKMSWVRAPSKAHVVFLEQ